MNNLKWFGLHRTRLKRGQALLALSGLWKFPRTRIVHKDSALTFFFHATHSINFGPLSYCTHTCFKMQTKQLLMVLKLQGRKCCVLICLLLPNFKRSLCLLMLEKIHFIVADFKSRN